MRDPQHLLARYWPWVVIALVVVMTPFTGSRFWIYNLSIVALFSIAVIGLNVLVGYAGQISFAPTTFMAIGGYSSALLTTKLGWDPWLALIAGLVLSTVVSVVIGFPILRLRGHYLAMGTFGLALATVALVLAATPVTNGPSGVPAVPPLRLGPINFATRVAFYWLAWVACLLVVLAVAGLTASRAGRAWRALATRENVALSLGVDVRHYKLVAFVVSAFLASLAGSLYAEFATFIAPDLFDITVLLRLFVMLFIGGVVTAEGPIVGAAVVTLVPTFLADLQSYQSIVFEIALLVILIVRPQGLVGRASAATPLQSALPNRLLRRFSRPVASH
jgi:branched-chain amino acid transport system permease protein